MYASSKSQEITEVSFLNMKTKLDKWLSRKGWWQ